jgi:ABC-2 type transport system ATP-binding protein
MLRFADVTKTFGRLIALERVSFTVAAGEVVGLLGPNGAGKTTALRLAAGFFAADRGSVEHEGRVGYLPESVALYPEMRVDEYLRHRAALKRVSPARVDIVAGEVGLGDVRRRIAGQLSKGYRQRVGLADALLAEPRVLLLDEPTDGLDPAERAATLALIARLGADRAVLLSTHVLPEATQVCRRLVILDRGRVVADDSVAALTKPAGLLAVARGDAAALAAAVRAVEGVTGVEVVPGSDGEVRLEITAAGDVREAVARAVAGAGALLELGAARPALDEVFRSLLRSG